MPSDNLSPKIIADLLHKSRILHSNHFIRINIAAVAPVSSIFPVQSRACPCHYPATRPTRKRSCSPECGFYSSSSGTNPALPPARCFPPPGQIPNRKSSFVHSIHWKTGKIHIRLSFSDLCDRAMVVIQITDSAKQRLIGGCEVIAPSDVDTHRLAGLHLLLHRCRFFCQSKISECECFPHDL